MIRDITIGQYYPAKSVLHRLDPRTKFLGTLGFLISVFLFHTFLGYAVATAFLVAMIAISKVPVKFMFKGLKAIVMILLITVVLNIILTPGLLKNNLSTDALRIRFLYHNRAKRINIRCTTLRQDAGRILHILRLILHYHILRIHCGTPHDRIISISIICGIIHRTLCITLSR